jgi:aminocarboxymuconate-semialdehyde decarboxylase
MIIDFYTHFVPAAYAEALVRRTPGFHPDAGRIADLGRLFPELMETDRRLRHMDQYGIAMQVLTPLPLPVEQLAGEAEKGRVGELVQIANDAIAETVARNPDRFWGIALLSFSDMALAVRELDRCVLDLGLKGAMLFTNIDGRPLDAPELFPLYQRATELDVPLWIHPVSWDYYPWMRDFLLWQIFGWPFDTTLAMARLVYSGVLERFPKLKLITHHSGGVMPYLADRIRDIHEQTEEFRALYASEAKGADSGQESRATRDPLESFRRYYSDVALSGSLSALECSYAFFGAEQLVFGTDYPFSPEGGERFLCTNLAAVMALKVNERDRVKMLSGNAKTLLHLS